MSANIIASIAPGLAEALAAIGSTVGIYIAVAAGIPATAEDPSQRGRVMVLSFSPATQAMVYGFVYMFMMYSSILPSLFRAHPELPSNIAGAILAISIFVGMAELVSAWMQGKVCADGAAQLVKTRGAIFGPTIILAAYEELFGILGMVFGYLMVSIVAGWA
uniref:ATPase n=1 Tax=Ignisphaera aggregans TaxID=334771 RepID=A0A7J2U3P2_9CREN